LRAFALDSFDAQPALRDDLLEPRVADDGLLVRAHASSVNPADVVIAAGGLREMAEYEFPVILGRDFAGVVEQVGSDVSRYQVGDEVFGFVPHANPTVHEGSWAELIAVPEDGVATKPPSLDFAHAGAAPLAALAAVAAFDALAPTEGEAVLVVGAAGGVGSFFVQLAAGAGANVIAPALPEDEDYLRTLGVDEFVDRNADVAAAVREYHPSGVDAVLDAVSFTPDAALLKDGGSRLASPLGAAGEGPGRFNVMAESTPLNFERLAELLETGTLRVLIQHRYSFEQAGDALDALPATHTQGKLSLTIIE
jgi:NADPH:quinone reductase-like Zn-dependent oxidoreductase